MRVRTGHGPDDWSPSVPASAQLSGIRGSLVVGAPGPNARASHAAAAKTVGAIHDRIATGTPPPPPKPRADRSRVYATDEERLEARRRSFRESKLRSKLRAEIAACREVA